MKIGKKKQSKKRVEVGDTIPNRVFATLFVIVIKFLIAESEARLHDEEMTSADIGDVCVT